MIDHSVPELDRAGLRQFGFTTGAIVIVLFGLFLPWLFGASLPLWPWLLAGVFFLLAAARPTILNPVYRVWMRFGLVMGWINTRIILFILFFGIFLVIAMILRVLRHDPMSRKLDSNQTSYRVASTPQSREHLEKPY